ncbi:unnamed protein product, partial [Mesorhabditis belari]|uniref:STAS domain-containing protein n=1 Tax=Mesorhabditis belari TaxID=2138241 RepID=A0AAF3ELV6_9BILA
MVKKNDYMTAGLTDRSDAPLNPENGREKGQRKKTIGERVKGTIFGLIPILHWLPNYPWKEWIHGDVIAGLTVGIMHVPQGMAYASLASVPPVVGMYSSFFTAFVYMFFGTARHISIGVFAVASMMVGACRMRLTPNRDEFGRVINGTEPGSLGDVGPLELTSALAMGVGITQLAMGVFRLGFLTTYLSDPLVSGFTTGSAAHVFMSQLNKVFGVKLPRHEGIGMLVFMMKDIVLSLPKTNFVVFGISIFGLVFLHIGREFVNPWVKKFSKIPVPLELILVIIAVVASWAMGLAPNYHVKIVDNIPRGFPAPTIPRLDLLPHLVGDAVPIAIVCYMFVVSMGKLFAKKHKYTIDSTQEFIATGLMHTFASLFPVYPVGASLSRSAVCEMSGAHTMLYVVFSSTLLLTVILFLGPFLEPLPMCILACIVIISLKSLFEQAKILPYLWKVSRLDFAVWLISCLATTFTDVTTGLIISIVFTLMTVVLREQWPKHASEKPAPNGHSSHSIPIDDCSDDIRVYHFQCPLHFVNVTIFTDAVNDLVADEEVHSVIVDCSMIAYTDSMGLDAFKDLYQDAEKIGKNVYYAALNESIISILKSVDFFKKVPEDHFTSTTQQAIEVILAKKKLVNSPKLSISN